MSTTPFLSRRPALTERRDPNLDGFGTERPSLNKSESAASCVGTSLIYESGFGCFNLNPAPGTQIERNYGRGPASFKANMRVPRTWSFGNNGESGIRDNGGGPPGCGSGGGGPPPGMFVRGQRKEV